MKLAVALTLCLVAQGILSRLWYACCNYKWVSVVSVPFASPCWMFEWLQGVAASPSLTVLRSAHLSSHTRLSSSPLQTS